MRTILAVASAVVLLGALTGCFHEMDTMEGTGTVRFIDLEGGFYGIETDSGRKLDPVNLRSEFEQDGLRVRFRVRMVKEVMTIHQWGTPVEILEMEAVAGNTDQ